ncbi:MAG: L-alanine-DL-glutamate epimerase and related enzymes of enolase superfamily [Phormidesmis priestleyi Ana]|uniref:Dipeptide epimerase n=1 Tax=Phormidesmis priestleyi Ana TaxID=1666911 RepID=A0A0N8KN78_9CYAN|nr:MAG: L-alanine-DL-glutamate epimerase and related enzymes of enolase superfamily [Phormidesmis priestleyi Ana]
MHIHIEPFTVHKRVPLTISRGTTAGSTNLWVRIEADGIDGWGEASPFSIGSQTQTTEQITADLEALALWLSAYHPFQQQAIEARLTESGVCSAARAAIDVALHDWLGKQVGLPLWQLWGLDLAKISPTAVTVGISSPEGAADRLQKWCDQQPVASVKVKLGNPTGIEADQAMFEAVLAEVPAGAKVSIDANGGWNLPDALTMAHWLADRGVTYLEQPLSVADDGLLPQLYERSPLPIFIDESCFTGADIPRLAHCIHGINIKLMKAGGLSEARRMIHTARACGLGVMFGCYSDSAIANTALSHLSPLADHLDLDSHFNLKDDPFQGAQLQNGALIPNNHSGLGLSRHASS